MQYVGKVGGYMYNQWNSLNPATLLGAIDIIVVEQPDGSLHCSPFHIRFGKFQIIKPLQKKIDFYVNDIKTDLPMKLGDGGEAFFVLEASSEGLISKSAMTSPVISPLSSPETSPTLSPERSQSDLHSNDDLEGFDLNDKLSLEDDLESKIKLSDSRPTSSSSTGRNTPVHSVNSKIAFEKAKKVTQKLNIPSKIDNNGDLVVDMDGYKPNSQKNIENSDEMMKKIFIEELEKFKDQDSENSITVWDQIIKMDEDGNIRISSVNEVEPNEEILIAESERLSQAIADQQFMSKSSSGATDEKTYFKTLRLTSDQLKRMNLNYGENKLLFKLNQGNSQVASNLYLWKATTPIVISDIDGTITKSDALGHVFNLVGKDWTHPGVAKLFLDIADNGYNIVYLTARSVGQADSTRAYLKSIVQENNTKLPLGPVILSPDRTMAALRREVILKKPEVFKMSCLSDIRSLYYTNTISGDEPDVDNESTTTGLKDKEKTPFYAGFGNRITDAISYRSVNIPSHRIFTINPDGEVHLELLELTGVKSSYLGIGELVDQYFPPIAELGDYSGISKGGSGVEERFSDVNYWREPLNLDELSDIEDDAPVQEPKSPSLLSIRSFGSDGGNSTSIPEKKEKLERKERPSSISSFASPLKGFMSFNRTDTQDDSFDYGDNDVDKLDINETNSEDQNQGEYNNEVDDPDEDDYTDEDYDEGDEDVDDDYIDDDYDEEDDDDYIYGEEEEDDDEGEDEEGEDFDEDYDEDLDHEEDLDEDVGVASPSDSTQDNANQAQDEPLVTTAGDLIKNMKIDES